MFGFGKSSQENSRLNSLTSTTYANASPLSLDGPPSPESIRAYNEQMKKSFGSRSRSDTSSSGTFSFHSDTSNYASGDRLPSRKSSTRSNASGMAPRGERPESMNLFSRTIFSRQRKSSAKGGNNNANTGASSSFGRGLGGINEVPSAKNIYYEKSKHSRKSTQVDNEFDLSPKTSISGPYNFQHLTHTHREQLPSLERTNKAELASKFSAIRASQIPTQGELKGIRAEELYFENFSSTALDEFSGFTQSDTDEWPRPKTSPNGQGRSALRKSSAALHMPPLIPLYRTQSHENINRPGTPPPRPPRSPLSPECPVALPLRVSSRTTSDYFDNLNSQRPNVNYHTRGFSYGATPAPVPLQPTWEQLGQFATRDLPARPLITPPGENAWPLTGSNESFGAELADVPEEEEKPLQRSIMLESRGPDIRWSRSFPDLYAAAPMTGDSESIEASVSNKQSSLNASPQRRFSKILKVSHDDWEDDIDYCYEHEAEADCYFEWNRRSIDGDRRQSKTLFAEESAFNDQYYATSPSPKSTCPAVLLEESCFSPNELVFRNVNPGRSRPSLLVPSPVDMPELSPISINSPDHEAQTPLSDGHLHPSFSHDDHRRLPSFAPSFKEPHSLGLSHSLLIPHDFASQVEQDQLYEQFLDSDSSALDMTSNPYIFNPGGTSGNRESMIMEGSSARSSFRSSGFSRGSISFKSSNLSKNDSQESVVMLSRTSTNSCGGSNGNAHSSVQSLGSLPELIISSRQQEDDEEVEVDDLTMKVKQLEVSGTIEGERESYRPSAAEEHSNNPLSPVAESFTLLSTVAESAESHSSLRKGISEEEEDDKIATALVPAARRGIRTSASISSLQNHGRKFSQPLFPTMTRPGLGGRQRSASSAKSPRRGSYMLFPSSTQS